MFPVSLGNIQAAAERLRGVAIVTPILENASLNRWLGGRVLIKPENLQHIGAFKFRGAYNRLSQLGKEARANGAVAYSSGNHAQGVAYAAHLLGMQATIVMPSDAPDLKIEGTRRWGATVRFYDRATESRELIAEQIASETGACLVPAFDDLDVIAGQGTVGLELMQQTAQMDSTPMLVYCPCGGGRLVAGVSTAVKTLNSQTRMVGVEPEHYDDHRLSREAGERIRISPVQETRCDALMAATPGELTWQVNAHRVDEFVAVSEDDIARAVSFAYRHLKLVIEPGGAVGLAALLAGKPTLDGGTAAVVVSGGNIDPALMADILQTHPKPFGEELACLI